MATKSRKTSITPGTQPNNRYDSWINQILRELVKHNHITDLDGICYA